MQQFIYTDVRFYICSFRNFAFLYLRCLIINSDFFRRVVVWNKGDRKLLCLQNHTFQGLRLCTFPSYIRKIRNTDSLLLIFLHALQVLFVFLPSTDQAALPNREVLSYTDATDPCINPGFLRIPPVFLCRERLSCD